MPRQLLNTYYRLNGALYIAETTWLKEQKSFFGEKTFAYVMERERSLDIDEMMDFQLAEILLKNSSS
jgi:N-acylneuraminate cytidylyltransferase/CMP-N,N'-diacetyllegionaminic acid synthase